MRERPVAFKKVGNPMSREEVAKAMDCSVERVRQIEEAALLKARRILEAKGYRLRDLVLS